MNITRKTMSNPVLIVIIFALIALTGLVTFTNLEVNLWPNIKEPYLMVSAAYENAGPQSVETAVTGELPRRCKNWIKNLSSSVRCFVFLCTVVNIGFGYIFFSLFRYFVVKTS